MKMMHKVLAILFPVMVLLAMTWMMAGMKPFYTYQFERNQIDVATGISSEDLERIIDKLAGYVVGTEADMQLEVPIHGRIEPVYGERELLHMVDVRRIFDALRASVVIYFAILGLTFYVDRSHYADNLKRLAKYGLWGTLVIVVGLGVLVMTDFTKYFYAFHEVFFTNDLWLLDPKTDVLIQMLPEVFFRDIAIAILVLSIGLQWILKLLSNQLFRLEERH